MLMVNVILRVFVLFFTAVISIIAISSNINVFCGVAAMLKPIKSSITFCRYNPENLATLERYVETQAKENAYDLEANLAVLKL